MTTFDPWVGMTERQIVKTMLMSAEALGAFPRSMIYKLSGGKTPRPSVPDWYLECFESYWKTSWRAIPVVIDDAETTPREIGYYAGYLVWMEKWFEGQEGLWDKLKIICPPKLTPAAEAKIAAAVERAFIPDELRAEFQTYIESDGSEIAEVENRILTGSLPAVSTYLQAKAKGVLGPSGDPEGELVESDACKVYLLLMMFWPWVIQFPSVTVLHRFIERLLGRNRAGNKARVSKLCERIGLRLRGRGRPGKPWPRTFKKRRVRRRA